MYFYAVCCYVASLAPLFLSLIPHSKSCHLYISVIKVIHRHRLWGQADSNGDDEGDGDDSDNTAFDSGTGIWALSTYTRMYFSAIRLGN